MPVLCAIRRSCRGFAFVAAALSAVGCSSSSKCPTPSPVNGTHGSLQWDASTIAFDAVWFDAAVGSSAHACFGVGAANVNLAVAMDCPDGPGTYPLAALHACTLESGICASIDGTLNVQTFVKPCGADACGQVAADLSIPATAGGKAQAVSGQVTLAYREDVNNSCGGGSGVWPKPGLN